MDDAKMMSIEKESWDLTSHVSYLFSAVSPLNIRHDY